MSNDDGSSEFFSRQQKNMLATERGIYNGRNGLELNQKKLREAQLLADQSASRAPAKPWFPAVDRLFDSIPTGARRVCAVFVFLAVAGYAYGRLGASPPVALLVGAIGAGVLALAFELLRAAVKLAIVAGIGLGLLAALRHFSG